MVEKVSNSQLRGAGEAYEAARLAYELGKMLRGMREERGCSQNEPASPAWRLRDSSSQNSGGRVLYLIDDTARTVWVVCASPRNPKDTDVWGRLTHRDV
ncbi:hypothetical protein [Herbidospora cretacea]|uniref:hypothetical protein n=1 Tax=Herbidospora cretacea TaxID=28444 RepID=UPI0018CC4743|nr:hypothetical protein [Herbidospora cretacea]